MRFIAIVLVFVFSSQSATADAIRSSLFDTETMGAASLIDGASNGGLFDRFGGDSLMSDGFESGRLRGQDMTIIRGFIQEAESRADGYDAVQYGARVKPTKRPTQMTLAEVFAWIEATPGQPHAIGRYQFVPDTLRRVAKEIGVEESQRFSPIVQDRLADVLLIEAGVHKFREGKLEQKSFMNNLAKIWAGLPNSTGKSHYDGYAKNKASVTWTRFAEVMLEAGPNRGLRSQSGTPNLGLID